MAESLARLVDHPVVRRMGAPSAGGVVTAAGHRCEHGVDDRVGVCADCVDPDSPDAPLPRYDSYAPRRAPYEPDDAAIAQAARSSAGAAAEQGDVVATITVRLRRDEAPEVSVTGPLSQAEVVELEQVRTGLWFAARELKLLQWYDPVAVQRPVTAEWERRRAAAEWVRQDAARKAAELEAEKPWLCRWCETERYATERGRDGHEVRHCRMNPDHWFTSGRRTPVSWQQEDRKAGTSPRVVRWVFYDTATPEQLDGARRSAVLWRRYRASRFKQDGG